MSITHCPTCKEPLRQFPSCGQCVNPRCDDYTEHPRLSPLPSHQDQSARLAASAPVDQVGGTLTLEQFQRWLEDRAHEASHAFDKPPAKGDSLKDHQWRCSTLISSCRAATSLLMLFKLEQGA